MEELKYYTPDIEDIRIGYECEVNNAKGYKKTFEPLCIDYKIDGGYKDEIGEIIAMIDDGYGEVRTPYLTKEQIEAEGWEWVNIDQCFIKNGIELYLEEDNKIAILKQPEFLYQGKCKSINEFKTICKWLNIC